MFFLLFILVVISFSLYTTLRLSSIAPKKYYLPQSIVILGIILTFLPLTLRLLEDTLITFTPLSFLGFLSQISFGWMIMMVFPFLMILCWDLWRGITYFIAPTQLNPIKKLVKEGYLFYAIAITMGLLIIYGHINYYQKERAEYILTSPYPLSQNYKIVVMSDLHFGYLVDAKETKTWVDAINKENPDLVLILGDLIDHSIKILDTESYKDALDHIKSRFGTYAILGNHEYISGREISISFLQAIGLDLLIDETRIINDDFLLVGRDDKTNRQRKSLKALLTTNHQAPNRPILILDHQPVSDNQRERAALLQHPEITAYLTGHSHRGQVWPYNWITDYLFVTAHGRKDLGETALITTSGIGIWGAKIRLGTQSEYMVIHLINE